jgi:sRNA-binding carbon storage regulator CsrA
MTTKIVNIVVPIDWQLPEIISTLAPEENAVILSMGSNIIREARNVVAGLSQTEIYNKIHEETKEEVQKLEIDLLVQKELQGKMEGVITEHYENQLKEIRKKNDELQKQLHEYIFTSKEIIRQEIYKMILNEKEKQVLRLTENYERFLQQTDTKSSKKLGDEGEDNFMMLSETFKDFVGYKIEKKSHQGHKGDFHLFFENFNVLVDLKNYTGKVQKKELEKIEHDLSINDTMDFAWLISYDSSVSDWNRFPIMCKWIVTDVGLKCIIIVNNLNSNKNPTDVLRVVWNMTNEIHIMMSKSKAVDNTELEKLRERDYNILQKIKMAQKRLSEMKRNVVSMSQIAKDIENDIIDAVSMFTNELSKNEFDKSLKIKEWWNENIDFDDNTENKLTSTDIWTRFKKDNKLYVDENKMLIDDFKICIKNFVDVNNYIEKSKKGSIEFTGFKFKDLLVVQDVESEKVNDEVNEKLTVELTIPNVAENKKGNKHKKMLKDNNNN